MPRTENTVSYVLFPRELVNSAQENDQTKR